MSEASITLLPGDGIGPEVTTAARAVLETIAEVAGHRFDFREALIGGAAIDSCGTALPEVTLSACLDSQAVFLGAVGGPRWTHLETSARPEQGLLAIRQALGLYANLRPVPIFSALTDASPLDPSRLEGVDLLFVRELTGGIYFGRRSEDQGSGIASDTMVYSRSEVERVAHIAFRAARDRRGLVTSVDKANVLASSRLWRKTVAAVAKGYPGVRLEHLLVDACAMHLIQRPADFDVVVTGNLFGDILSDEASVLSASLGMLPSASLGDGKRGLYEPVHGSAPDIVETGQANPIGAILSAAMLLRHSLDLGEEAGLVDNAVEKLLAGGTRTADLCRNDERPCTTREFTARLVETLRSA